MIESTSSQHLQKINASIIDAKYSEFYTKTKNILNTFITCGICRNISKTNQIVKPNSCNHVFCRDCLQQNFIINKSRECPVCKQKIYYMQPLHLDNGTLKTPILFKKKKKYNTDSLQNMLSRMQRIEKISQNLGKRKRSCTKPTSDTRDRNCDLKRALSY